VKPGPSYGNVFLAFYGDGYGLVDIWFYSTLSKKYDINFFFILIGAVFLSF